MYSTNRLFIGGANGRYRMTTLEEQKQRGAAAPFLVTPDGYVVGHECSAVFLHELNELHKRVKYLEERSNDNEVWGED